jgi:GNAT superfamily N-acetyltransferase
VSSEITVREAAAPTDVEAFWTQLHEYFTRDLFPDPEDEDRDYFLGSEYREQMQHIHDRGRDRCHYLFFCSEGRDVGFAMPVIYDSEDGKCFIMEFCVYPEFRGKGIGRMCA